LKNYIIRIYRFDENKHRGIVGVVEEVGVKEKKAFTNYDELWEILRSVKDELKKTEKSEIHFSRKHDIERRNEMRIKKEIPFVFIYDKRKFHASTINYSKNGLGIKISKEIALPVGDTVSLQARDSSAEAQVMWVDKESVPSATMAGLKIVGGTLNIKGIKTSEQFVIRRGSKVVH